MRSRRRGRSPAAVPITGLVVTKVDGTARGGIVVAVHEAIDVPVKFLGTGEQVGDLEAFDAGEFAARCSRSDHGVARVTRRGVAAANGPLPPYPTRRTA